MRNLKRSNSSLEMDCMNEVLHVLYFIQFEPFEVNGTFILKETPGAKIYLCFQHSVRRSQKFFVHTETRIVGHYNEADFVCWDCEHD